MWQTAAEVVQTEAAGPLQSVHDFASVYATSTPGRRLPLPTAWPRSVDSTKNAHTDSGTLTLLACIPSVLPCQRVCQLHCR